MNKNNYSFVSVPEAVEGFTVTLINSSSILISWRQPNVSNGVILFYRIDIYALNNLTISVEFNNTDQTMQYNYTVTNLGDVQCINDWNNYNCLWLW